MTETKPKKLTEERRALSIQAMREVLHGAKWKEAGEIIGVGAEQCKNIVHKVMRMSLHPSRMTSPFPEHNYRHVVEARKNRDFWLDRADTMAKEWNVTS